MRDLDLNGVFRSGGIKSITVLEKRGASFDKQGSQIRIDFLLMCSAPLYCILVNLLASNLCSAAEYKI